MSSLRCIAKHPTIALVDSCTTLPELHQIHAQLLVTGLLNIPHLSGNFVATMAAKNPNNSNYADRILDQHCHPPPLFALNAIMRAYSKSSKPIKTLHVYTRILNSDHNLRPDNYTFNFLTGACTQLSAFETGRSVHCAVVKHGFENDPHIQSGLISMYAQLGYFDQCRALFMLIPNPDAVCRSSMLTACVKSGHVDYARQMFDEMPERDPVAWNAMVSGYSQSGKYKEALELFHLMQSEGVSVNARCMASVISACSHFGALDQGKWAHAFIERNKIRMTVVLGTALIDMYAKCGNVTKAMEVFWGMKEKNEYTWSSALGGLAMNGYGHKCLEIFSLMKEEGVCPNEVTFVSILKACSVVGLVEEGRRYFDSMRELYGIEPVLEHYGCIVDLYGRAGRLDEALNFINNMPMKPHAGAWGALLNACRIYRNVELGELAAVKMMELEDDDYNAYVALSNIYADCEFYPKFRNVRNNMKAKGLKKLPGCSVIEVDGEVHEFFALDNKSHPRYNEIKIMLAEISRRLRLAGYVPTTNRVVFDIEQEEKEDALFQHSEKFAIAFGLISVREGVPIRIVNNLRVCWDCHEVTKLITKSFNREIIVRDRKMFHHFENGECSCKDYW